MTPRRPIAHLVSVSGGKDSTATLLLALEQFPDRTIAVFADTGNEHELTYDYLTYLEQKLGIRVERLKARFDEQLAHKREWVQTKWREHGVPESKIERALAVLQPTGVPYLDLCMWKGRFPSRMAQFCTAELKTLPLTEYAMDLIDFADVDVWSWQGVRRDESPNRAHVVGFEEVGGGLFVWRPIAGWTAQQTVDFVRSRGVELNPLYSKGMDRVGCMPCINAKKSDIAEIARRFPEHIERIAEWERLVADASKRDGASFFPAPTGNGRRASRGATIHAVVEWAKTKRGGVEQDPVWDVDAPTCSSSYGLCE